MNVIETLHERLKGLLPGLLGINFVEASTELIKASLVVRPDLCTAGEILHGGTIMAFADTLGAVGTVMNLPPNGKTVTVESKTNFFSPAPVGSTVIGESTPLHRGRRMMTWQTRITAENGKLVAIVIQTQMILQS
ncbi:MAG: PaaI family thioesterase [Blastocatellales bacterium]